MRISDRIAWAEDVPEADVTGFYERMWAREPGGVMLAEINQADVRLRLHDRFPGFAAALDLAVDDLSVVVRAELTAYANGWT